MRTIIITTFIFFSLTGVFGQTNKQSQLLRGKIESNDKEVMYANIGIIEENVGTITDQMGYFELEIPNTLLEKKLTISHIGYRILNLNIDSLIKLDKVVIQLTEKTEYIDEAIIISKKLNGRNKELGNKRKHDLFLWIQDGDRGSEIATLITPKSRIHINSVSINVLNVSQTKFTLLLNIYALDKKSKLPGKQLLRNQLIINSNKQKGWLDVELKEQNLVLSEPFFVSFQWTNVDEPIPFVGAKHRKMGTSLIRYKALGTWQEYAEWDIKVKGMVYNAP